jgi:hypothetical protein
MELYDTMYALSDFVLSVLDVQRRPYALALEVALDVIVLFDVACKD